MNVLLTPYARVERNPEPLLAGLISYNSNDGFGRADQLNFAAPSEDEAEYAGGTYLKKGKVTRQDPLSHRIIEKRRRDRMNNCLADLSRLIPPEYVKKGRGRVEKTEIIEMAIRHLKYLDNRVNGKMLHLRVGSVLAAERQTGEEHFRAGYHEAVGEAIRFLVEVRGYSPADGLCVQMNSHMQRQVETVTKEQAALEHLQSSQPEMVLKVFFLLLGEALPREGLRSHPNSSSETNSSSSSQGYLQKGVIAQVPAPAPQPYEEPYPMDCDRGGFALHSRLSMSQVLPDSESQDLGMPIDGRRNPEPKLRAVRKPEHTDDFLHSYKFKNSIERRFSRSQDSEITEAKDMSRPAHVQNKVYTHKRRRAVKLVPSESTSNSGSNEETRDNSPQDTSSDSAHHHNFDKSTTQYVPIFALNASGKYYVPLSVETECLSRHLGTCDTLDRQLKHHAPLHPVTINVNFQSCMNYHVKRERTEDWQNH